MLAKIFSLGKLLCSGACACAPGTCTITICVKSPCTANGSFYATGVTVTVKSGSTVVASGTTTSNTVCLVLTVPAGTYTVTTTGNPRYVNTSNMLTFSCGGTVIINLSAATGYFCICPWMEPIPTTLTATGGTGSTTFNATVLPNSFSLPQTVTLLTPDTFGVCNGTITTNPCTTGSGSLSVPFIWYPSGGTFCGVEEDWIGVTDCTQTGLCPGAVPIYYIQHATASFTAQWSAAFVCFGYCPFNDGSVEPFAPPLPVPVNVTLTFPAGSYALAPPISSVTFTE